MSGSVEALLTKAKERTKRAVEQVEKDKLLSQPTLKFGESEPEPPKEGRFVISFRVSQHYDITRILEKVHRSW